MPASNYPCPECGAVLRPAQPIPVGKRIKCPKCSTVFAATDSEDEVLEVAPAPRAAVASARPRPAPKPAPAAGKPTAPAPEPPKKPADDDEDGGAYGIVSEDLPNAETKAKPVHYGEIRDKFHKSKRGPAMAKTVQPANALLMTGAVGCLLALMGIVIDCWPMIFTDKPTAREWVITYFGYIAVCVVLFVYCAAICYGAMHAHGVSSYAWATVSGGMGILFFPVALFCIYALVQKEFDFDWDKRSATPGYKEDTSAGNPLHRPAGPIDTAEKKEVEIAAGKYCPQAGVLSAFGAVLGVALLGVSAWTLVVINQPDVKAGFDEKPEDDF